MGSRRKIARSVAARWKTASMRTPHDLEEIDGCVKVDLSGGIIKVQYFDENNKSYIEREDGGIVFGHVTARQKPSDRCYGAFSVGGTEAAPSGWGPLLYDIVLEYASMKSSGLTSNREMVSKYAYNVWETYLEDRPDVEVRQLDDLENTLTPEEIDNCYQSILDSYGDDLRQSPLAKLYSKSGTPMMDKLKKMGRLVYGETWI